MEDDEDEEPDFENGSIIDNKYSIVTKIGSGGFGKAYKVEDLKNKNIYAAKIPFPSVEIKDFLNEIKILRILSTNININNYVTKFHDSGRGDIRKNDFISKDRHYLISKYISKGNLCKYLMKTEKGFQEKHAKIIFSKILEGVQFIHNSDICHLDLTLDNILLDDKYNPIITDFGLSTENIKDKNNKYELINDDIIKGTEPYICPDMRYGKDGYYGIKADIFSLGVLLFYLVTNEPCFISAKKKSGTYDFIINKKYDKFWESFAIQKPHVLNISQNCKDLFIKLVTFDEEERPNSVNDIFNEPWLSDVQNFKNEDYTEYETMMKSLENEVDEDNETYNIAPNEEEEEKKEKENNEDGMKSDEGEIIFNPQSNPEYLNISGLNAMNYIKINGELESIKFMNLLATILKKRMNCKIKPYLPKLKFKATFPNKLEEELKNEEEEEEEKEEKEEEKEEKEEKEEEKEEEKNENKKNNGFKKCEIKIELFEFTNGGYEVHFNKGIGNFTDYYSYFMDIKKYIKEIL